MTTALLIVTQPLDHAPQVPVRAIALYRAAGHQVYVACPAQGNAEALRQRLNVHGLLPLVVGNSWLALVVNLYRVSFWARRWRPELFLSLSLRAALLAHSGRGSNGGYGLSVLYLTQPPSGWLAHHAFRETDRVIVEDAALAEGLRVHHHARGADLTVLEPVTPETLVGRSLAYFAEPPGVLV